MRCARGTGVCFSPNLWCGRSSVSYDKETQLELFFGGEDATLAAMGLKQRETFNPSYELTNCGSFQVKIVFFYHNAAETQEDEEYFWLRINHSPPRGTMILNR